MKVQKCYSLCTKSGSSYGFNIMINWRPQVVLRSKHVEKVFFFIFVAGICKCDKVVFSFTFFLYKFSFFMILSSYFMFLCMDLISNPQFKYKPFYVFRVATCNLRKYLGILIIFDTFELLWLRYQLIAVTRIMLTSDICWSCYHFFQQIN